MIAELAAAFGGEVRVCVGDRVIYVLADYGRGIGAANLPEELG